MQSGDGVRRPSMLDAVVAEIERHVAAAGWDQPPQLFALVPTPEVLREQPDLAPTLGVDPADPSVADALTPIEQDPLPEGPLDAALAQIEWPEAVTGCALAHEVVMLPPEAEASLPEGTSEETIAYAAQHPGRQEIRLVAAVLRDGTRAAALRRRRQDADTVGEGDLLCDPDLAPDLCNALLATLT